MKDWAFQSLLTQNVAVDKCTANVSDYGAVTTPQYVRYVHTTKARITPARENIYQSVLGERSTITHKAYMENLHELQPGNLLIWKIAETYMIEDAEAGASEILAGEPATLAAGQTIEIGHAIEGEEDSEGTDEYETAIVAGVDAEIISLKKPLAQRHPELSPVSIVRRFEVVNVRRWPGMDHHIELALKELEI